LFAVLSTTYGAGDGSTTFALPDMRGRVAAGLDNMGGSAASRLTATVLSAANTLGATGGTQTHVLAAGELPSHTHPAAYAGYSNTAGTSLDNLVLGGGLYLNDASQLTGRTGQANTPNGGAHLNTQPTIVLNYIIKF
jgi:microcystin-dependent protein